MSLRRASKPGGTDLRGKVCVVTGASSGIGRETAADLARLGAQVCVAARREARLVELVAEMGGEPAGHSYVVTDVSDRAQVKRLARHVEELYGRCDVLINNAGVPGERGSFRGTSSIDNVERVMAINFFGAVYCTGELLGLLERSAPSHVVNVASMAGRLALGGASAYSASKFALAGWSEALHTELAPRQIYVSSVEPGLIPTEGFPQSDYSDHRLLRFAVSDAQHVSKAIREAIAGRKMQRVVPRWYYLLQLPRLLTPGLYRLTQDRVVRRYWRGRAETGER